jgi:glycosyltransferase involved in cell wall biosynthesis
MIEADQNAAHATVVHVDLAQPIEAGPPPGAKLVVCWWKNLPVGHIRLDADALRHVDFAALVAQAVDPAALARARAVESADPATRERPTVSVVICTRDRPNALRQCLASLPQQTRAPDQVVVVDNASVDGRTREVARAAGVTYVREDRPGLDIARNTGALAASGEIVAYTDDDVRLHHRWLERLVAAFERPDIMAVTGLVLPAELETPAQEHFERYWGFGRGYLPIEFGPRFFRADRWRGCEPWRIGAGANMAFRREVFATAGLFDERLDVGAAGCSGDSEYWHRVLSHGGLCRYDPAAVAFHYHRRDEAGLSRQIFAYMRGHAAALMVQFERTGNFGNVRRAFFLMPRHYLQRLLRRLVIRDDERDRFLMEEVRGFFSGLVFYFRTPRSPADRG